MNYTKILSKKNQNIQEMAISFKQKYLNADPFPHIQLDNFFAEDFLNSVLNNFPDLSNLKNSQNYQNINEIKFANNDYKNFPDKIKLFFDFLNSDIFLKFLQEITSINEKLFSDPELNGGGLHEIKSGGLLKVHTDFNKHPSNGLDRRINVLIYMNKNWKEEYNGSLELWDKNMRSCRKKITPIFNRMVIFSTTDFSNHGHPDAIKCSEDISRKSIALYYFSNGRPAHEILDSTKKNKTYFKNRFGYPAEVSKKREIIKNFLRKFKFYSKMKNFEKKYLRKKKTY
ncbi:2OG-Fe(II) oxygenase [Pelagibacteraceae bacterium]|nr:2OG-Fe(II) oxygenase [Pelagibacteraceae bacterium]